MTKQETIYEQPVENIISFKNKQIKFKLLCDTSTGTVDNIASVLYNVAKKSQDSVISFSYDNSTNIQNALNALANQSNRFKEDNPDWVTKKIKIKDLCSKRTTVVGVREDKKKSYYGYTEILLIVNNTTNTTNKHVTAEEK